MVAPAPFAAQFRGRQLAQRIRILDRESSPGRVAVERPRLNLRTRELAAMQQLVERMKMVIAHSRRWRAAPSLGLVRSPATIVGLDAVTSMPPPYDLGWPPSLPLPSDRAFLRILQQDGIGIC